MTDRPWQPSCTLSMLRIRGTLLRAVREFFGTRGYLEVETPCLSRDIVIDAWLEPMELKCSSGRWFLQTSPEAFMKRLLASGSGSIFQISRVFRDGESGQRHNPEFTMLEWYGANSTWQDQVALTEQLVRFVADAACGVNPELVPSAKRWPDPFSIQTYADAFWQAFGMDVHTAHGNDLLKLAQQLQIPIPDSLRADQRDDLLNLLLAFGVEPRLGLAADGRQLPVFLCDFPPSQAALAVTSIDAPHVARRFELYAEGLELCNGYQELTDVSELRRREVRGNGVRQDSQLQQLPGAPLLQQAMESGLPACSGVALGFDRLVMLATGATTIDAVMAFPASRC